MTRGRPKNIDVGKPDRSAALSLRVTLELKEALEMIAREQDRPTSYIAIKALEEYAKRHHREAA